MVKVHEYSYIQRVFNKCRDLRAGKDWLGKFDGDTLVSEDSLQVAVRAAGAVIEACDKVMSNAYKNAFCAVRPPGHHAGVYGPVLNDKQDKR